MALKRAEFLREFRQLTRTSRRADVERSARGRGFCVGWTRSQSNRAPAKRYACPESLRGYVKDRPRNRRSDGGSGHSRGGVSHTGRPESRFFGTLYGCSWRLFSY